MNNNIRENQILNLDDIVTGRDTRTTIMIKNIPLKYTEDLFRVELREFNGKYDLLYMPFDYDKNMNRGYALINFVNPLLILYFYEMFNLKRWQHFNPKCCELFAASLKEINEIQNKGRYYPINQNNENIIIPSKYILKLKERFPNIYYDENNIKKIIIVKSFE